MDLDQRIATQLRQLAGAEIAAKKGAGDIRQLMRLVKDEGIDARQHLAETLVTQRQIGKKQMMIHHQHIGGLGVLARLHHKTVVVDRAITAQTVVGGGGDLRPDRCILRHGTQLGDIAPLGAAQPGTDACHLILLLGAQTTALGDFQTMMTEIVGPPLEQGNGSGHPQRLAHGGKITMKQLILQVFGAGGDHHLFAAGLTVQQRGHQIGVGFTRAGTGLGDEHVIGFQGAGHRLGHVLLLAARRKTRHVFREGAVWPEDVGDGLHGILRLSH